MFIKVINNGLKISILFPNIFIAIFIYNEMIAIIQAKIIFNFR